MVRQSMLLVIVVILTAPLPAQDRLAPPRSNFPQILVARAVEKNRSVVVTFATPKSTMKTEDVLSDKDGKTVIGKRSKREFVEWSDVDVVIDGNVVRAFGVDGKAIDPKDLPKRLGKSTQVAVVLHYRAGDEPELDPYYLRVLREDIVVFTGPVTTFNPSLSRYIEP
jgi:hypothetical protein